MKLMKYDIFVCNNDIHQHSPNPQTTEEINTFASCYPSICYELTNENVRREIWKLNLNCSKLTPVSSSAVAVLFRFAYANSQNMEVAYRTKTTKLLLADH
jgi:hypothetical protein